MGKPAGLGTRARPRYTEDSIEEVHQMYMEHGLHTTARETGIPVATVGYWAHRFGWIPAAQEGKSRRITAAHLRIEEHRTQVQEHLVQAVDGLLIRLIENADDMDAKDANYIALGVAILIDKLRLELGEATIRIEHKDTSSAGDVVSKVIQELVQRRMDQVKSRNIPELMKRATRLRNVKPDAQDDADEG